MLAGTNCCQSEKEVAMQHVGSESEKVRQSLAGRRCQFGAEVYLNDNSGVLCKNVDARIQGLTGHRLCEKAYVTRRWEFAVYILPSEEAVDASCSKLADVQHTVGGQARKSRLRIGRGSVHAGNQGWIRMTD